MLLLLALGLAHGQEYVYDEGLAAGWSSWSWSGSYDFAATDLALGTYAIAAEAGAWGALSLHSDTPLADTWVGIRFAFAGDGSTVSILLEADGEGYTSDAVPISDLAATTDGAYTWIELELADFGDHAWTRIDFMDTEGFGTSFHVDEIQLIDTLTPGESGFTAAEPIGPRRILLVGDGDASAATVSLDGRLIAVSGTSTANDPARVYLDLAEDLGPGELVITAGALSFTRTLAAVSVTLDPTPTHEISPLVYGVAFPEDYDAFLSEHGITAVRWGGNAVSTYNPFLQTTSAAADWYFENRDGGDAAAWIRDVHAAGAVASFTLPVLDWVAKDTSSYGYSVARYGPQQDTNPWNGDAGNGVQTDGTPITWNDPNDHMTPWTVDDARDWLESLSDPPDVVFVGNELDIASGTHQDVHPEPVTYDEVLERYLTYSTMLREVYPDVAIAGPASCCWWYYWNSAAGWDDKAAHGDQDLLEWFLDEVAAADAAEGVRRLDVLDIHFYPDGVFNDLVDEATRARRLRSTRALWDPTYTDEGWIGTDEWATQTQPNPNQVQLIPRFQALIDAHYPGTLLGLTEWNFGAEEDLSGGLAVADVLGILGREDVHLAHYWTSPESGTPAAAAFALYGDRDRPFGARSLPVHGYDPDLLGAYAALDDQGRTTVVVVNKDPDRDVLVALPGLSGAAEVRHFGGALEGAMVDDPADSLDGTVVVPAYGAVFVAVAEEADTDTDTDSDTDTDTDDDTDPDSERPPREDDRDARSGGCGCSTGLGSAFAWPGLLMLLVGLRRPRRRALASATFGDWP